MNRILHISTVTRLGMLDAMFRGFFKGCRYVESRFYPQVLTKIFNCLIKSANVEARWKTLCILYVL